MVLGNTPLRLTNIHLEANKSFALNIRFLSNGDPYDITDAVIRIVAVAPKHKGGGEVLNLVADHLSEEEGRAQFKFQASDTALEPGEYAFDGTFLSVRDYSTPFIKGFIIIGDNADPDSSNIFEDVHPTNELVVLFGTSCDVEIYMEQADGLLGPRGDEGPAGPPIGMFVQDDEPEPDEVPTHGPLWVDTDEEFRPVGYVWEAPEPPEDMGTGVLYFDNDETVIPPDGVGVLYVKAQSGELVPVTRRGLPGADGEVGSQGPPGPAIIVATEPPDPTGLPEGTQWVDEDSDVPPYEGGDYLPLTGGTITGDLEVIAPDHVELEAPYVSYTSWIPDTPTGWNYGWIGFGGLTDETGANLAFSGQGYSMPEDEYHSFQISGYLGVNGAEMFISADALHITGVVDPVNPSDAASKAYVDAAGGGLQTRTTASITTASLAAGATESGTIALAPGYRLYRITTSAPARVRLYTTATKRDADAARPIGTDPTGDHGCLLEFVSTAGLLAADLSPVVDGFDGKATPDGSIPISITNTGTGAVAVTVTLTWIRAE